MEELQKIGLHLNSDKTEIFTTVDNPPDFIDVDGDFIGILRPGEVHKYLGKHLPGEFEDRSLVEVQHRIRAAWGKFHQYRWQLTNSNILFFQVPKETPVHN